MANKLILLPEQIYRGLVSTDTGEPNLDFTKRELDKIRRERNESSKKNIKYNQELRRYLKLRKDREDRPIKVEIDRGARILMRKGDENEDFVIENERHPPPTPAPPPREEHEWMDDDPRIPIEEEAFESLPPSPLPSPPLIPPQNSIEIFHQGKDEEEEPSFPSRRWIQGISNTVSQVREIANQMPTQITLPLPSREQLALLDTHPDFTSSFSNAVVKKNKNRGVSRYPTGPEKIKEMIKNRRTGPVSSLSRPSTLRNYHLINEELEGPSSNLALPSAVRKPLGMSTKSKAVAKKKKNTKAGLVALRSRPSVIRNYGSIRRELEGGPSNLALPEPLEHSALPSSSIQLALEAPLRRRGPTSMEIYGRPGVKYRRDPELIEVVSSAIRREMRKRKPIEGLPAPGKEKKTNLGQWAYRR
jgi:hypothetical protein